MRPANRRPLRRAAAMVEAAIIIPVFLLIVLGTIDVGLAVFRYNLLAQAARQEARQATVHGSLATSGWNGGPWGTATIDQPVTNTSVPAVAAVAPMLTTCPADATRIKVEWTAGKNETGDPVRVTISSEYTPMISWIVGGATIDLSATSTMLIAH